MEQPQQVTVPTFELMDCPTLNIKELREKGLDCVIRNEAMVDGELRVFAPPTTVGAVLDSAKILVQAFADGEKVHNFFSVNALADGFAEIEKYALQVTQVFVNPEDAAAFVEAMSNGNATLDEIVAGAVPGALGRIWDADVRTDAAVPKTRLKLVSETAEGFYDDKPVSGPLEHWV